jgi:hypothetical protein
MHCLTNTGKQAAAGASRSVARRRVSAAIDSYVILTRREGKKSADAIDARISSSDETEVVMSISLILLIIVILLLVGALPTWGYSSGWGYWPSGGLGLVLLILIILMVMGRI